MCGRARAALSPEEVAAAAGVSREAFDSGGWVNRGRYSPTVNAQPGAYAPVARSSRGGGGGGADAGGPSPSKADAAAADAAGPSPSKDGAAGGGGGGEGGRVVECMKWGLVPSFTRDAPDHFKMFNETVASKGVFSRLLPNRRCVVLLNGFYEWKAVAGGKKQPYYVHLKGPGGREEPMRMAGLWDEWTDPEGQKVRSFTMITTDSSPRLAWLHDRMPALLRGDADVAAWLGAEPDFKVIRPYNGEDLAWHPVTQAMSKPSYQGQDACRDVRLSKGSIHAFFKPKPAAGGGGKAGAGGAAKAAADAPAGEEGAGAAAELAAAPLKQEAPASPPKQAGGGGGGAGEGKGGSQPGAAALNTDDNPGPSAADEAAAAKQEGSGKRPAEPGDGGSAEKKPRAG